MRGYFLAS